MKGMNTDRKANTQTDRQTYGDRDFGCKQRETSGRQRRSEKQMSGLISFGVLMLAYYYAFSSCYNRNRFIWFDLNPKTSQNTPMMAYLGRLSGKFGALHPEGRIPLQPPRRDLGQVLHSQLPVELRHANTDTVSVLQSGAPLSSSGLEEAR